MNDNFTKQNTTDREYLILVEYLRMLVLFDKSNPEVGLPPSKLYLLTHSNQLKLTREVMDKVLILYNKIY